MRIFIIVVILLPHLLFAQNTFPKNSWKQFTNPKDAGFSMAKLEELKERFNEFGGDALLIIRDGKVVLSLGETS